MTTIRPDMTPARLRWLEQLDAEGVAQRGRGAAGYNCARLGWTEWVYRTQDGEIIGQTEFKQRFGAWRENPATWDGARTDFEMLTADGRRELEAARARKAAR